MPLYASTKRALRAAVVSTVALLLALSGCAGSTTPEAAPASSTSASGWTYTDDLGHSFSLDHMPNRIVGFADQALSLMSYGVQPVGVFGRMDVASDPRFSGYDMSTVTILGTTYGEIDLEALAALQPDLIVTAQYPSDRQGTIDPKEPFYGLKDLEQQKKLEAIAPIVTVKVGGAGLDVIESNTRLALSLGADQGRMDADRRAYETSAANLTEVAKQKNLLVAAMYADADGVYLVKTADEPETQLYASLGVNYLDPNPDGDYYWDIYSWENAGKVKNVDVILISSEGFQKADLLKQATFADSPALVTDQVYERSQSILSYGQQAKNIDILATQLEKSNKVT